MDKNDNDDAGEDYSDSYLPPQVRPYWHSRARHEHREHMFDVLLAGICGAILAALIVWKLHVP